jgi:Rrf2 family protein
MLISKKTKYALKALIHLGGLKSSQPVLISELAQAENIPKKFLEFILLSLRKGGILQSRVGKGGGYYLAMEPAKVTIGSVVRILEGDLAPVQCLSETNYAHCDECQDEQTCGIKLVMADVNTTLAQVLDNLTLADMLERSKLAAQKQMQVLDFSI